MLNIYYVFSQLVVTLEDYGSIELNGYTIHFLIFTLTTYSFEEIHNLREHGWSINTVAEIGKIYVRSAQ